MTGLIWRERNRKHKMIEYKRMAREEIPLCAEIAARSFADYAYFSIYVPNRDRRLRFLKTMLRVEFSVNFDSAELWTAKEDEKISAVAMLCSPDYRKPSDAAYMKAGFWKVFLTGGVKTVNEWNHMDAQAGRPCHGIKHAWYLSLLTVDPVCQGRGVGSAMLKERIIPRVIEQGGNQLTLFTNSKENCAFYEKNGFHLFHETDFKYRNSSMGSWSYMIEL